MGVYQALKELTDYQKRTGQSIAYDDYYFKCGEMVLNQHEYDMSSLESRVLHGQYLLYETKLDGALGRFFRNSRSVEFQRDFYTKLFIYDKIRQIEKENGVHDDGISSLVYNRYVVELNTTTNIDGEQTPKRATDMFQDFAKEELKEDKEFLAVINAFCNNQIEMTFSGRKKESAPIYQFPPVNKEEEVSTSNEKQATVINFCKKINRNTRKKDS